MREDITILKQSRLSFWAATYSAVPCIGHSKFGLPGSLSLFSRYSCMLQADAHGISRSWTLSGNCTTPWVRLWQIDWLSQSEFCTPLHNFPTKSFFFDFLPGSGLRVSNRMERRRALSRRGQAMATDKSDWRSRNFENDDGHPPNSMPFVEFVGDAVMRDIVLWLKQTLKTWKICFGGGLQPNLETHPCGPACF